MNCEELYKLPEWVKALLTIGFFLYPMFEWWLGRTTKTKAGSIIDLFIGLFKARSSINHTEVSMLEGNEFEKDLGSLGKVVLDIDDKLMVKASVQFDGKKALEEGARTSNSPIVRGVINFLLSFVPKDEAAQ